MPTIEFKPPVTDWDGLVLTALRYWPNDDQKRLDLLRACFPMLLDEKKRLLPEVYGSIEYWAYTNRVCQGLGGWKAIADAPRYSDLKASICASYQAGVWVGITLTLAQQMIHQGFPPHLVSVNRLAYLIEEFGEHLLKTSISKPSFLRAWVKYKSVAHLWAAHLSATQWWNLGGPPLPPSNVESLMEWSEQETLNHLLYAQQFFKFGTKFVPAKSKGPLLDPASSWQIIAEVEGEPFELPPLPKVIVDALQAYPKKKKRN